MGSASPAPEDWVASASVDPNTSAAPHHRGWRDPISVWRADSEGAHVGGIRALGAFLRLVLDLGTLGERFEALAGDAGVVDEQILTGLVRRDAAEALLVAEPLHGSSSHWCTSG